MADAMSSLELDRHYPVTIQVGDDIEGRMRGTLLGRVTDDRMLLCGLPPAVLKVGDRVIVRMVQSGKAWGFESVVREMVSEPALLYFLDIPAAVETLSLRKAERLAVFIPADVRSRDGDGADVLMLKGVMLDISAGGCRLYTKRRVPANAPVNVSFALPGDRQLLTLSGVVLDTFVQRSLFGQRVRFHHTEKNLEDLAAIRQWVAQNAEYAEG